MMRRIYRLRGILTETPLREINDKTAPGNRCRENQETRKKDEEMRYTRPERTNRRPAMTVLAVVALLAAAALHPAVAYDPVIRTGVESTVSTWAWGGDDDSRVRVGPFLDLDYRTTLGERAYWGSWYRGTAGYDTIEEAVVDDHTAGLRLGGSVADHSYLLEASLAASSDLGDDTTTIAPDWSAGWDHELSDTWRTQFTYSGLARIEELSDGEETDTDRVSHGVDLDLAWDPSLLIGYRTGPSAAITLYPDWNVLDDDGTESDEGRRDISAEYRLAAEGLIGFFTLWSVETAAGIVDSTANRRIDGDLEESEDRTTARTNLTVTTRPSRTISLAAALTLDAGWYTDRTPLDTDGVPRNDGTTHEIWTALSLDTDWRLTDRWSLSVGADGGRVFSNDELLAGWTISATLGLEARLW